MVGRVEQAVGRVAAPGRNIGFPYRAPTVPRGVEVPVEPSKLGPDYETAWARSPVARVARGAIAEGPLRLAVRALADPDIVGLDRLTDLLTGARDAPTTVRTRRPSSSPPTTTATSTPR